jgi:hypothetical protein
MLKIHPGFPHQDFNGAKDTFSTSLPSRFFIVRVSSFSSASHKDENAQTISTPSSRGTVTSTKPSGTFPPCPLTREVTATAPPPTVPRNPRRFVARQIESEIFEGQQ